MKLKLVLLGTVAVGLARAAYAEAPSVLETMVVTANRTEQRLAQTLQHTTLITPEIGRAHV